MVGTLSKDILGSIPKTSDLSYTINFHGVKYVTGITRPPSGISYLFLTR